MTLFNRFKKWVFLIDIAVLWFLSLVFSEREGIFMVLMIVSVLWNAFTFFRVWRSNGQMLTDLRNYRVLGIRGPQGAGKSSMMCKLLTLLKRKKKFTIVTNVPMKLHNDFTHILTKDALAMRTRLPEPSAMAMDEMSLYFNNLDDYKRGKISQHDVKGCEAMLQLIRHNIDGNFIATSVKMGRVLARLEEKFGMEYNMLEQKSLPTAFIFPFLYNLIRTRFLKKKYEYFGVRRWKVQKFLAIQDGSNSQGYTYDLSTDNANTKTQKYAPLVMAYAWNDNSFEYDDRFAKDLYKALPEEKLRKYTSLQFTHKDLKDSGFDSMKDIYASVYEQSTEKEEKPSEAPKSP